MPLKCWEVIYTEKKKGQGMDSSVIASTSNSLVVMVLACIAALFFKFSPVRHEQINSKVLRDFMRYFGLLALVSVSYVLRLFNLELLSVVLVQCFYLAAIYCLRNGFKWRVGEDVVPLIQDWVFVLHLFAVLIFNVGVFYMLSDSLLARTVVLYISAACIYLYSLRYFATDGGSPSWGERVARVSLMIAASATLLIFIPLLFGSDLALYKVVSMVMHAMLILLMTGALLSLLLSDVVILHYRNSLKDPLTGLYNRRYFSSQANVIQETSKRYAFPVSLVLCDIDHFKSINDTFGHAVGDSVLQDFAARISAFIREGDLLARFGGEEFVLLLPQTQIEDAQKFAERLRSMIEQSDIVVGEEIIKYTASFGVSPLIHQGDLEFCLNAADEALYRAKHEGRNRVKVSPLSSVFA